MQTEQVLALGSSRFGGQIRHSPRKLRRWRGEKGQPCTRGSPKTVGAAELPASVPALPSGLPFQGLEKQRGPLLGAPTCERTRERPVDIMIYLCYLTNPFIALSARHHAKPSPNIHSRNLHSNPGEDYYYPHFTEEETEAQSGVVTFIKITS